MANGPSSELDPLLPAAADAARAPVGPPVARRLYLSHFLSTWNSRFFEFGAVLFIAAISPGSLLAVSIYALARAAAAILFASLVGTYVDTKDRLHVVTLSIVGQRVATMLSCIVFLSLGFISEEYTSWRISAMVVLPLLACVEKLSSMMNTIAVERDWVVVVAEGGHCDLQVINSQMRRIDLFCKLVGPLVIALVAGISTRVGILVTLVLNLLSTPIEYFAIARVYRMVDRLQEPKSVSHTTSSTDNAPSTLTSHLRQASRALRLYVQHPSLLPSLALSLLYLTVLSFGGQFVAYLLAASFTPAHIGVLRAGAVVLELAATWLAPAAMRKVGPVRAGLWFLSWQLAWLALGAAAFVRADPSSFEFAPAAVLVGGVILSRVGLWGFDLCAQVIIQESVEPSVRGAFSATEASVQNLCELLSYGLTALFARPDQFRLPVLVSVTAVALAAALYAEFVRRTRGHLVHMPACMELKYDHEEAPYVA